jgi:D-alanyl-D-alanine carboxypeptidase (penicillin-binding protein 5/6)
MTEEETTDITEEDLSEEEGSEKIPVFQQLGLLGVIMLLIFGSAFSPKYLKTIFSDDSSPESAKVVTREKIDVPTPSAEEDPAFQNVKITGKAAYVWDVANQRVLFKKNESDQLPLASVTKLMTALIAQELLDESESVRINDVAIRQDGNSGLSEGEVFERLTLNDLTLMSSSNDGAFALAVAAGAVLSESDPANAFVQAMNIRAEEIGLSETYFKNPTGLDISTTEGGAYGTARDMAFLMEYIVLNEPDILTYTREIEANIYDESGVPHDAENTNYYIEDIPGLIGSKTGYTDLAGGNLVIAFDAGLNRPVIISVLGSTRQSRFTDVLTLVEETQKYVAKE